MIDMLQVEPTRATTRGSSVMAIGLHNPDRNLTRSDAPSMFGFKQIPPLFRFAATSDAGLRLAAWSVGGGQLPVQRSAEAEAFDAADECSCGLALTGEHAVYNEEAFRYLLDIEQKRFEAAAEPYVLIIVQFA